MARSKVRKNVIENQHLIKFLVSILEAEFKNKTRGSRDGLG
jgi:hypothetical protein